MPPQRPPGGYTFREGFSVDYGEQARYRLFYRNGTANREVHFITSRIALLDGTETTTVDGTDGREPLLDVVEAAGCPGSN